MRNRSSSIAAVALCCGAVAYTAVGKADEPKPGVVANEAIYKISVCYFERTQTPGGPSHYQGTLTPRELKSHLAKLENTQVRVLASPTIVTAERREAKFQSGYERTFTVAFDGDQPRKETVFIGTKFNCTPKTLDDGRVSLAVDFESAELDEIVHHEVAVPGLAEPQAVLRPIVGRETMKTSVTLPLGETMQIGGTRSLANGIAVTTELLLTVERFEQP